MSNIEYFDTTNFINYLKDKELTKKDLYNLLDQVCEVSFNRPPVNPRQSIIGDFLWECDTENKLKIDVEELLHFTNRDKLDYDSKRYFLDEHESYTQETEHEFRDVESDFNFYDPDLNIYSDTNMFIEDEKGNNYER